MIEPVEELLVLRQNATFNPCIVLSQPSGEVDLTGVSVKCQIRAAQTQGSQLYLTFDSAANDGSVVFGTTTENGQTASTITLFSAESANEALSFTQAYYDVKITWADGTTDILMYGGVTFVPGVTQ